MARSAARMSVDPCGASAHEVGQLLFQLADLARLCGVDAESALREANGAFEEAFRTEERLRDGGTQPLLGTEV